MKKGGPNPMRPSKGHPWRWTEACHEAFGRLKVAMANTA